MRLTGRFNFHRTLFGTLVLQVEEEVPSRWNRGKPGTLRRRWRKAHVMDLTKPELRALIDLRVKHQYVLYSSYAPAEMARAEWVQQAQAPEVSEDVGAPAEAMTAVH
jgi:hypothetical protein